MPVRCRGARWWKILRPFAGVRARQTPRSRVGEPTLFGRETRVQRTVEGAESTRQVSVERELGRGDVHGRLDGAADALAVFVKLLGFGRTGKRGRRTASFTDHGRDLVEVARADLALMARRGVSIGGSRELDLLEIRVRAHPAPFEVVRQPEETVVQGVESGQRYELELVAHLVEPLAERRDRPLVELLLPIERRRAVVREHLTGKLRADRSGESFRLLETGFGRFHPHEGGVRCVRQTARDTRFHARARHEKTFGRTFSVKKFSIDRIYVAGDEFGGVRVGAGD